ncbi:helix-turn-helix domain-containing protein [Listeria booriae]|uniref:helix-turn-helix domain-containing protein n=1 Tax=Listeria booriae TaxID=1552123 RepID=UPI001627542F|nr:helix-turn-helix domain-containing protein [Listeria booriae]MBC2147607.1 hypothetical protein [Listeria booriae]
MVISLLKKADKKLNKLLNLVNYLCNSRKTSIRAISLAVNRSRSSVQNDLEEIRRCLPNDWSLHIDPYTGAELIKPFNQTENDFIAFFVQQSLVFQLVFAPFSERFRTVAEAADNLFVSKKALYDLINHLNSALEPHQLRFDKKTLSLRGKEEIVRNFYLCLLTYANEADLAGKSPLELDEILQELGINLPKPAIKQLEICCIVAVTRRETPVCATTLKALPENNFEIIKFLLSIQYHHKMLLHDNDKTWLLTKIFQIIFQEKKIEGYGPFKLLEQQAVKFNALVPKSNPNNSSFIQMISHHIMSKFYFPETSFNSWNEFSSEETKFMKSHPELFSRIVTIYEQLDPPFNVITASDTDIIFQTALFIRSISLESTQQTPTVYVLIKKGVSYENHCINLFNLQFKPWLFKAIETDEEWDDIQQGAIVISDQTLMIEDSNNILVSPKPTELDLESIRRFLETYLTHKNSDYILI